ncbi:penicillin acylase family protein [Aureibaculum sp. 2210JD6-5]|uniref:penicillin acylase family protein n=1 Tax=Aureibaculum sp. 2210JD6-5 TaxID=3103957 RepID=UPI002AADD723|nr:penicillin acylase family protein [Aureibaculum sp. 2210JD6-5]MDY7394564.1 penicillin acylase family protein [Aureibaculum sp. 2210JD6-5]
MRFLKKLLKYLLVLIILIAVGVYFFLQSLKPTYEGELKLASLTDKVEVYYDNYGIPHIYAQNELDARRALGYVHAQDRLWQMEVIRRLAAGRLSELFGEKLIRTDKFFSGLGIEEASVKTIAELDKSSESYKQTMAYLDGVNQFIKDGPKPIEFYLLGIDKEEYTLNDVYNVFGYMAFSFAIAHKTDPLLTQIKENLGDDYLKELNIPITDNSTLIKNEVNPILKKGLAQAVNDLYENLPVSPFIGSNAWVIGPEKTKNGKVILANDSHIGFGQPSVWYQSHIKTPDYEMYGYNLALTPFPLLGHDRHYAYGVTMFENDDVDFYFEENNPQNPNEYKTPNGYETYKIIDKEIKVKDAEPIKYQIKVSKHGPVMNDIIEHITDERPIAMSWIYTQLPNKMLEASFGMSHSKTLHDFKNATALVHAPGLNIMYGDADDNIAWFAVAKLYKLNDSVNSKTILNGASGTDEKIAYLDFSENPQAINPKSKYVYSANNQPASPAVGPDSIAGRLYPGYYLTEDRAKRIVGLLEAKNDFTKEDVMEMINDVTSSVTPSIVENALRSIKAYDFSDSEKKAIQTLQNWDGSYNLESVAPTIYNRFLYEFLVNTFKDEMGSSFELFLNNRLQKEMNAVQMAKDSSIWWDDISTKNKIETKQDIITKSLKNAVTFLESQLGNSVDQWTWNKVHTLEHKHPMGEVAMLRKYFNVGPFEINGGSEVINNLGFKLDSTGYYQVTSGPSTRRVIDFSDVESSMSILPTGQSGNVLNKHYKDQAEKFNKGEFVPMLMNEKVIKEFERKLVLMPESY